jgi:hypothetical protein
VIKKLHEIGMSSTAAYIAGMSSIGMSLAAWIASLRLEKDGRARADRWGIFVGLWAPTFMSLGNALRLEEEHGESQLGAIAQQAQRKTQEAVGARK